MKKTFLTFALILVIAPAINAQVTFKPGVKAGINLSRLTNTEGSKKVDFYIGGFGELKLSKFYSLQPELVYSRQGSNIDYVRNNSSFDPIVVENPKVNAKLTLEYLSLGIINKFTIKNRVQILVGPTVDFRIGDKTNSQLRSDFVGLDLAFVAGLGYSFNNGLSVEARFKQGVVDIYGDNYNDNYYDSNGNGNIDDIKLNQLFQFGASYTFDLK